jgi:5'(3')-deoxyribonucleotidase
MRISIDFDDVIVNYVSEFVDWYNHVNEQTITEEDIIGWDLTTHLPIWGENDEMMRSFIHTFIYTERFKNLKPVEGAVETIKKLLLAGHEIYIITSRSSRATHLTYKWLERHGLPINNVFFDREKDWICKHYNIRIHIDDGSHNLQKISEKTTTKPILYTRHWNQKETRYERVHNWTDINNKITELNQW